MVRRLLGGTGVSMRYGGDWAVRRLLGDTGVSMRYGGDWAV